jgi:hypothetical protein
MSKRPYHSLLSNDDDTWCIQFGDYSRAVVKQEREDTKERGTKYKIVTTADDQASIYAAVAALNQTEK